MKKENRIQKIVNETFVRLLHEADNNTIILYRNYNKNIAKSGWILLSEYEGDAQYGKNIAIFKIPLNSLKIADYKTVIGYIKKFDITCWDDAFEDEYIDRWIDTSIYTKLSNGEISEEEAYNAIPRQCWAEIMEYPEYYTFSSKLQSDGYDGYCFNYMGINIGCPLYYAFFDASEILRYCIK